MTEDSRLPLARTPGTVLTRHRNRPKVTRYRRALTMQRANGVCETCRQSSTHLELDHIIPVVLGGSNVLDNLRAVCWSCNSLKGSMLDCEAWT